MRGASTIVAALLIFAVTWTAGSAESTLTTSAPTVSPDYAIGPGDLIRIAVFAHPELALDARVSQSGNVTVPPLGQLKVVGRSSSEVESDIARGLTDGHFVRSPQVSVAVIDYESQLISVMGQVVRPGQYPLTAARRVLDLLAAAGGIVNLVAADDATLVRRNGAAQRIDLLALFNGDPLQNPEVGAGDTIYVPRAPQFYIDGQVQRPGAYRLERHMTVSQAISAGGGVTLKGSERRVIVKRRGADGREQKLGVSGGDLVQPDDVLFVKESLF